MDIVIIMDFKQITFFVVGGIEYEINEIKFAIFLSCAISCLCILIVILL